MNLYKRNAQGKPLVWSAKELISQDSPAGPIKYIDIQYGLVGGNLHKETISITKKNVNELQSRVNAKRKEGYKEINELKDSNNIPGDGWFTKDQLRFYLETYLPKYSTTSEGFVLPMLAKVLEDNKPFDKDGAMLGQWKINGLRCLIGATKTVDLFKPIRLTYHSRTGEDWTDKMFWMDDIILCNISKTLLECMIEEGAYLDGELYLPGYNVNDINSFVKNDKLPQHYQLQYWCYDIAVENMSAQNRRLFREVNTSVMALAEFNNKNEHLNNEEQFVILPTLLIYNLDDARLQRDKFIDLGFEGLILRKCNAEYQFGKRNQSMFKYKRIDDGIFNIVDIKKDKRGLPIFVLKNDINDELFECTINASQELQKSYIDVSDTLKGKPVMVEYRERSGIKQVPFHAKIIKFV